MAGSRKEYDLIFKIAAEVGGSFNQSFGGVKREMSSLQQAVQSTNRTLRDIDGYTRTQSALENSKAKMAELEAEHKRLQTEISNTEKPSEKLNRELEKNENQISKTAAKIEEEESKLKSLSNTLKTAGVNTSELSSETSRLKGEYDDLKASQDRINDLNTALSKNATQIQNTKNALGKTAMTAGVVAAGIYKAAVEPSAEFNAKMSAVGATAEASNEDLVRLTNAARELGRTTKFTALEVAEGMGFAAQAGWTPDQIIAGMPGILNLAAAADEDLASVSDIVTDALTAMKMKVEDSGHFADVLAKAAAASNVSVATLGESFKYCAPLAGAFNFNIEDTALMLSIMGNNGIKASNSGTALRRILSNLTTDFAVVQQDGADFIVTTTNADGSMRSLKEIIDDVRVAFNGMSEAEKKAAQNNLTQAAKDLEISLTDENGKLKSQAELYAEVTTAAEGLTEAGKVQEAESIAGKTAMAGLLSIINTSDEDYNKLTDAIYNCNGAAEEMANKMLDNLKGDLTIAKSAVEGLQIALGDALTPELRNMVQEITPVISNMAEWAEKNPETVVSITKLVAKLLTLKAGLLGGKLAFHELKNGVLLGKKAFETYKGALAAASLKTGTTVTTTTVLKSALGAITSPAGLATIAIGGVVGGIALLIKRTEEARQKSIHFAEDLVEAKENFDEVNKRAEDTHALTDEYRKLSEIVKTTAENSQENADAKARISEIEQELIDKNPEILSKYDQENGKIEENLDYLDKKLDREREIAKIKLDQENHEAKLELPKNKEITKELLTESKDLDKQYDNAVKMRNELDGIVSELNRYDELYDKGGISEASYDKIIKRYVAKVQDINKVYGEEKYQVWDSDSIKKLFNIYESKTSKIVEKISTNNDEVTEARENIKDYYDKQQQIIEYDSGISVKDAVTEYKNLNNELYKLNNTGKENSEEAFKTKERMAELEPTLVDARNNLKAYYDAEKEFVEIELGTTLEKATSHYKDMNDELYRLNSNGQGSSERAKQLRDEMAELKPQLDDATQRVRNLGKSVEEIPEIHSTTVNADTTQASMDIDTYTQKLNEVPTSYTTTYTARFDAYFTPAFTRATNIIETSTGTSGGGGATLFGSIVSSYGTGVKHYATGGIITKPTLATFAEEGPEAAIPLDGSRRAKELWYTAGRILGTDTAVHNELPAEIIGTSSNARIEWNINPVYNIYGGAGEDITEQLEANNRKIMAMIEEKEERARRLNYA